MTIKDELIQELNKLSEADLEKVLAFVRVHVVEAEQTPARDLPLSEDDPVWQAYLESEREREEVYCRLASF